MVAAEGVATEVNTIERSARTGRPPLPILHFVADEDDPYGIVARLRDALAPGSYLAIVHMLDAEERRSDADTVRQVYSRSSTGVYPRTREQVMRFFGDFELLDNDLFIAPALIRRFSTLGWGAVARKPGP